jgi:putative two-component system response regulator
MENLNGEILKAAVGTQFSGDSDILASGVVFTPAQVEVLRTRALAENDHESCDVSHVRRVGLLSFQLGLLAGLDLVSARALQYAASLHDVGKSSVPLSILNKPGKLSPQERDVIEGHAEAGARMLEGEGPHMQLAAEIARHHHEWWNGYGYPCALSGKGIPLSARIVAIADVFDALISSRPYKLAWRVATALSYIEERAGTQFDPRLVLVFVNFMQAQRDHWSEYEEQSVAAKSEEAARTVVDFDVTVA